MRQARARTLAGHGGHKHSAVVVALGRKVQAGAGPNRCAFHQTLRGPLQRRTREGSLYERAAGGAGGGAVRCSAVRGGQAREGVAGKAREDDGRFVRRCAMPSDVERVAWMRTLWAA